MKIIYLVRISLKLEVIIMDLKKNILKFMMVFFILLNIIVLVGGYVVIDNIFATKGFLKSQEDYYLKKQEDMIQKIDIIKQSNADLYSNIKLIKADTESLQADVLAYTQGLESSQDENLFLKNKLSKLFEENNILKQNIAATKVKLKNQNQKKVVRSVKKRTVRRTTRSS